MQSLTCLGFVFVVSFLINNVMAITDSEKLAMASKVIPLGFQCAQDNPLTLAEMIVFKNKMFPEGDSPKCFTACMFKKVGIMDDMGMLTPEVARKKAEPIFKNNEPVLQNIEEIIKFCSSVNEEITADGEKGCDRAKLAYLCLMENGPKYGFDFDF